MRMAEPSDIVFKISGPALSFLYYECDKSRMDLVGFLIGEKHSYLRKTISDSERNGVKNELVVCINACLTVGAPFLFCSNVGRVDRAKLKDVLGPVEKDVCGWFMFRRNSELNPLLRGTMIHRELLNALPHVNPESFVLCCIGADSSKSGSTHRYRHVFLLYEDRMFQPISVPCINLGQPQDSTYRTLSQTNSSSVTVNEIIRSLQFDKNASGLTVMKAFQRPLQERIMQIAAQVRQYDQKTQSLQNEILEMKYKVLKNSVIEQLQNKNVACVRCEKSPDGKTSDSGSQGNQDKEDESGDENEPRLILREEIKEKGTTGNENSDEIICSSQNNKVLPECGFEQVQGLRNVSKSPDSSPIPTYEQSEEY